MPTPTHRPGCETLFFRPARCQACDQIVYFWGCSCGSRVLFDATEKPWPKHRCTGASTPTAGSRSGKNKGRSGRDEPPNVKFISTYTYGVSSVVCMRCGKTVRKRELDAHNYYTHGIGKKPAPDSSSAGSNKPLIACPQCGSRLLRKNLREHLATKCPKRQSIEGPPLPPGTRSASALPVTRNVSPAGRRLPNGTVSAKPVTECEVCSTPVRLDRLEEHMRRIHPAQVARRNGIQRGGR